MGNVNIACMTPRNESEQNMNAMQDSNETQRLILAQMNELKQQVNELKAMQSRSRSPSINQFNCSNVINITNNSNESNS